MNKNQLKSAFDSFNPADEQKHKIFDNLKQKAYGKNKIDFKRIYIPVATVAAAAFIFAIGSGVLNGNAPVQMHTQIVQNTASDNEDIAKDVKSKPNNAAFKYSSTEIQSKAESAATQEPKADTQARSEANAKSQSSGSNIHEVTESAKPKKDTQIAASKTPTLAALNINTVSAVPNSKMIDAPEQVAVLDLTDISGYDATYEEFCKKSGTDITKKIKVADDMQNITQSEKYFYDGEPESWDITYIGEGARSININASVDVTANNEYFENTEFIKTDINGNEAVVFYDDSYSAYINSKNVSYTITGVEITEQELSDILVSLSE